VGRRGLDSNPGSYGCEPSTFITELSRYLPFIEIQNNTEGLDEAVLNVILGKYIVNAYC